MDPNETLRQLRELTRVADSFDDTTDPNDTLSHAWRCAELFEALDQWLTRGGFLPDSWQHASAPADPAFSHALCTCDGPENKMQDCPFHGWSE